MKEDEIRPRHLQEEFLRRSKADIKEFFSDKSKRVHCFCIACKEPKKHKFQFVKNGFDYVECLRCGTLFANPRPTEGAINKYYRGSKATKYWADYLFKETADVRRKAIFVPKAKMVVDLLKVASKAKKMKDLVEVGMGYGIFAEEARKLQFFKEIIGIEPSLYLSKVCREKGFKIIEKPVEKIKELKQRFAAAVSFEVIEHLYSPERFLKATRFLLKRNGYLVLTTPNIDGFELLTLWNKAGNIFPPHHINFFNPESLGILLSRTGYRVIKSFTPGKLDVNIVENKINLVSGNRFVEYFIKKTSGEVKDNFQKFLQENNLSSHMCILAQVTGN